MSLPQRKRLRRDGSGKRQRQRILGEKWKKNKEKFRRSKKEERKKKIIQTNSLEKCRKIFCSRNAGQLGSPKSGMSDPGEAQDEGSTDYLEK